MTQPASQPDTSAYRKANCSECGADRKCNVRGEHMVRYDEGHFSGVTYWYILECRGCENVFIQKSSTNSEDWDNFYDEDGAHHTVYNETLEYFPSAPKRTQPPWLYEYGTNDEVIVLYKAMVELYTALNNDLRMLSAIGIRTAYDIASRLLNVDPQLPFNQKLDALVVLGRISEMDKSRLETVIEAGSASAHRGWRPVAADLNIMMDVLEHFVYDSFVAPARKEKLNDEAAKLKMAVPQRIRATKKPK